ncbi:Wd40 repeat protein [Globisporangium polare]
MDVTTRAEPPPSPPQCVDAGDLLFLIVKHLRLCGLSASAMALLRESEVDTAWLCGPSREMQLLREWVFAGDLARAKTLLQPLAGALADEELRDAMAVIGKQQLLEAFYLRGSDGGEALPTHKQRQAILDELRTRRQELGVTEGELSQCMRALLGTEACGPILMVAAQGDSPRDTPQWDVNEARMQCFERLVPFFRGDIGLENDEHMYLAMAPTQLMALVQDGVTYNSKRAVPSGGMAHLDCISAASGSHQAALGQLHNESSQQLFLVEKQFVPNVRAPDVSHLLSRSMDWSRRKDNWVDAAAATTDYRKRQESSSSEKRRHLLALSLDFDKTRLAVRRPQRKKPSELLVEEDEDDDMDSDQGAAQAPSPPSSVENESKLEPVVKVLIDSSTQTDTISHHIPISAPDDHTRVKETSKPEAHDDAESLTPAVVPENNAHLRSQPPATPERPQPEAPESQLADLKGDRVAQSGTHRSHNMRLTGSDPLAMSFTSDASRSVCIDDDEGEHDQLLSPAIRENKSPISKYLEEEEGEDQEDQDLDVQEQNLETGDIDGDPEEEEPPDRRPERYDQLTLDHIVRASVVAEVKEAHAVRAIDLNASGSQLAIGTNARALRVFDLVSPLANTLPTGSSTTTPSRSSFSVPQQHSFLPLLPVLVERHKHHQTSIYCVAYNNNSSSSSSSSLSGVIASGDADSSIKILSLATNKELLIQSHHGKIRGLHFAADNLLWSTATGDLRIRCWDLRHSSAGSGSSSCMDLDGHVGEIQALAFAQNSSHHHYHLLSASLDKTIRLWDHRSGKCERIVAARLASPTFTLQFDPTDDARYFASGHQDGSVGLWDLRMKEKPMQSLAHHQDECRALSWSPDGAWLLSSSFDGTICIMQASGTAERTLAPMASYHQHQDKVLQAQWHPSQPAIVTTGADKLVKLWTFA